MTDFQPTPYNPADDEATMKRNAAGLRDRLIELAAEVEDILKGLAEADRPQVLSDFETALWRHLDGKS